MDNSTEKPIAFASLSLAPAEKKCAHLDKEAMAIVFGAKKFHQFLAGHTFTIVSDHKPLHYLFSKHKATPVLASARIQRWALTLGAYDYRIVYKPGAENCNADGLSRLPGSTRGPIQRPAPRRDSSADGCPPRYSTHGSELDHGPDSILTTLAPFKEKRF